MKSRWNRVLISSLLVFCVQGCYEPYVNNGYKMRSSTSYNGVFRPRGEISFRCHEGYTMRGYHTIRCGYNGRWDRKPPECQQRGIYSSYCRHPGASIYPDKEFYKSGDIVFYKCQDHQYRYGYSTCTRDGGWLSSGECYDYCRIPKIDGGYHEPRKSDYRYGDEVKYYCNNGHYPDYYDGEYKSSVCGKDGQWDRKAPSCKKYCYNPDHAHFHHKTYAKEHYKHGEKLLYHCEEGYYAGSKVKYPEVTCKEDGHWDEEPYVCEKGCKPNDHSKYHLKPFHKPLYRYGEKIRYECEDGFYRPSKYQYFEGTCGRGGRINKEPYKCQKGCEPYDHAKYYLKPHRKTLYKYGEKVKYDCMDGYYKPSKYVYNEGTCGHDGKFDKEPYECEMGCIAHDYSSYYHKPYAKKTYKYGETMKYDCDDGYYDPDGEDYKTPECVSDGKWDPVPHKCLKYCKLPDYRKYKHRPYNQPAYKRGEKIQYHCQNGHFPPSEYKYFEATCGQDGLFNKKPFTCEKSCEAYDHSSYNHKKYSKAVYRYGETIRYACEEGYYNPSGNNFDEASCGSDGQFDKKPFICMKYCPYPLLKNGRYEPKKTKYVYSDKIEYKCNLGYSIYYKEEEYRYNACNEDGEWKHLIPLCKKYCLPPQIRHGHYAPMRDRYNTGDRVAFGCEDGYVLRYHKGPYEVNECHDDGYWKYNIPSCEEHKSAKCDPPHIRDGYHVPSKEFYEPDEKVHFHCNDGYQMHFHDDYYDYITCGKNGKFDHKPPLCSRKENYFCQQPYLNHGSFEPQKQSYSLGDRVYYGCDDGYKLHFPRDWFEFSTCNKNGAWDFMPPECKDVKPNYCKPPLLRHGSFKPYRKMYDPGERIYYNCLSGYQIKHEEYFEYSTCHYDGTWDFKPPKCLKVYSDIRKYCFMPEFYHGRLRPRKSTYEIGEELHYSCDTDYNIDYEGRPEYSVCNEDGTWDREVPKCRSKYINYCDPPNLSHGSYTPKMSKYNPGDRLRYECDPDHNIYYDYNEHYDYATCLQEGKWDKKPPTCSPSKNRYCPPPSHYNKGHYEPKKPMYTVGDRLYFSCYEGYQMKYNDYDFEFSSCKENGGWDFKPPRCEKHDSVFCDPPNVEYGYYKPIKKRYAYGDRISYGCRNGYFLYHDKDRYEHSTCMSGGMWDFTAPRCKPKSHKYCDPPDFHFGFYEPRKNMYNDGDRMYYYCDDGYDMHYHDDATYEYNTCQDGKWNWIAPYCMRRGRKYCKPPVYHHGSYYPKMNSYNQGDRIWYHCNDGYMEHRSSDKEYATCGYNGLWDFLPRPCKARSRRHCMPPYVQHGSYGPKKPWYSYGDKLRFVCQSGYDIMYYGNKFDYTTCKPGGKWAHRTPMCKKRGRRHCSPPRINDADYRPRKQYYFTGDRIYVDCKYGFYIYYGNNYYHRYSTCNEAGRWDVLPACKRLGKYCKAPKYSAYRHKAYAKRHYMVGEKIRFECDKGYYAPANMKHKYAKCKPNGYWDFKPVKCQKYCMADTANYRSYSPMKKYYKRGEKIRYFCRKDFRAEYHGSKQDEVTCGADGKWNKRAPECKKSCPPPAEYAHRNYFPKKNRYNYGERIEFYCNDGYAMNSRARYSACGHYGKWDKDFPQCYQSFFRSFGSFRTTVW